MDRLALSVILCFIIKKFLIIFVKFDDLGAGIKAPSHDNLGRSSRWVPIEQNQATFTLKMKSKSLVTVTWHSPLQHYHMHVQFIKCRK